MSGTGEDPLAGFPAIGQYELVPEPGEPGYEEPETLAAPDSDEPLMAFEDDPEAEGDDGDVIDPDSEDPFGDEEGQE
jgi:hypothetical protein